MFRLLFSVTLITATLLPAIPVLAEAPGKTCMSFATLQRTQNIAEGISRSAAYTVWVSAVQQCAKRRAKRKVVPRLSARYVPPGRNGAPEGTVGGGTRFA